MNVLDAHTHIFEYLKGFGGNGELRPIGGGKARWADGTVVSMIPPGLGDTAFTAEALLKLLEENGVGRAVLLQGSFYGFQNEYVAEAVKKYPDKFLGAGTYDPFAKNADAVYERLTEELGFRAMKFETSTGGGLMSYHDHYDIYQRFHDIAGKMVTHNQTLVLDIGSPGMSSFQPGAVKRLAEEYPELHIVICHLLAPRPSDWKALEKGLLELDQKHIWFDLAAVPFNVQPEQNPYPTGLSFIRMASELIGYKKLLWGTDVPSVLNYDSYQGLLSYLTDSGIFAGEALEAVLYGNAVEAYRWD